MWSVFRHMKQWFPFFNNSFLVCTSETILHLSDQWFPSQKTHFLPLPSNEWLLLPPFLNFLFSLWTDDEPDIKMNRHMDGLLNLKSLLPSDAVCDGNFLGVNCPGGSYPRWVFCGWELSGGNIRVAIFRVDVFPVPLKTKETWLKWVKMLKLC